MAKYGTGFDSTGPETLLLSGRRKGQVFRVTAFHRGPGTSKIGAVTAAVTGRDLILKYSKVPTVPDWQLAKLMDFEVQEIAGQAGGSLSADYNLLPVADEMTGEDTILLALAKDNALTSISDEVQASHGQVHAYTPNPVAVYNAFLQVGPPADEEEICLVAWVGESSLDLALLRGTTLLFARNVSGGLSTLDGAIAQTFNVRDERAGKIRRELLNLDPGARGNYESSQVEKVAHSVQGVSGMLQAALRSTLAFCQSQTNIQDLRLDKILLCGPGAKVKGMSAFLSNGLNCPVDVWDPVESLDLSALDPAQAAELETAGPESVVVLGLALAPCFDELYSIEILPETVKKKRRLVERTIWNIAAAVLAVLFLGMSYQGSVAKYDQLSAAAKKLKSQASRVSRTSKQTKTLIEKNGAMAKEIAQLEEQAVPLYGTARLLRAFREILPVEFWIRKIQSREEEPTWAEKPDAPKGSGRMSRRGSRRMIVIYEGLGVPLLGRDIRRVVYPQFENELESRVPKHIAQPRNTDPFQFSGKVDFLFQKPN